ncbi:cellulose binding domain-containing protein [Saccharothrix saharensis]|uniref:Cellulose binding domain-containing protein n=1 Tax=Saccharothrix saharensis TaxID=571190 RepID=A0A543JL19_9PSEU|nr:cellulose-binding domain-containing protein [Saccharothrix saharensis]TQM83501.1 cellulose binding domain-containing protein [Saccharothrix saharensis]
MHFARIVRAALAVVAALVAAGLVLPVATARAAVGCDVDYAITDQWRGGFGARVTLTNLGDPLSGWTLEWAFTAGQKISSETWNGVFTQAGAAVRVRNAGHNGAVGTGRSVTVGFNGTWSGSNPAPTSFTVDGVPCTGSVVTAAPTSGAPEPSATTTTAAAPSATSATTASTTTTTRTSVSSSSASATSSTSESAAASGTFDWPTASPKPAVVLSADISPESGVDALRLGLVISLLVAAVGIAVLLVVRRHLGRVGDHSGERR